MEIFIGIPLLCCSPCIIAGMYLPGCMRLVEDILNDIVV